MLELESAVRLATLQRTFIYAEPSQAQWILTADVTVRELTRLLVQARDDRDALRHEQALRAVREERDA